MKKSTPRFSSASLQFLLKAGRQKRLDWLDRNRDEYERVLLEPLKHLASVLKSELGPVAPGYNFPQKGIGRLKRPAHRVAEYGGAFRDWMSYSAARPRTSRFDHNPNLFLLLNPDDRKDPVLVAGGLYMPSSRQLRSIRQAIAEDASAFEELFKSRDFSRHFKGGFSREKTATRPPRGFDPAHPKMDWLKLQAYFVWKPYSRREFSSASFPRIVAGDFRQILRLNALLEQAISGAGRRLASETQSRPGLTRAPRLSTILEEIEAPRRKMDF